jgi:hypothetical protein
MLLGYAKEKIKTLLPQYNDNRKIEAPQENVKIKITTPDYCIFMVFLQLLKWYKNGKHSFEILFKNLIKHYLL